MEVWTIQKLLNWVSGHLTDKGIDAPRLSAELLLCVVLGLQRIELYTKYNQTADKPQLDRLRELVQRAGRQEPIAYLTGRTEFYSIELEITPDCMIPRPETELLVQRAVEFLRTREGTQHVCDLCTGCGCIAVAIAKNFQHAKIIATDISSAALGIADRNVRKHGLQDRFRLLHGDLFDPLVRQLDDGRFDLIVCNPPYVSTAEYGTLAVNIRDYEPKSALLAGQDGLDVYRRITKQIQDFLKADAALMLEIGYAQGPSVSEMFEQMGLFGRITVEKDLHANDRVVIAERNPAQIPNSRHAFFSDNSK